MDASFRICTTDIQTSYTEKDFGFLTRFVRLKHGRHVDFVNFANYFFKGVSFGELNELRMARQAQDIYDFLKCKDLIPHVPTATMKSELEMVDGKIVLATYVPLLTYIIILAVNFRDRIEFCANCGIPFIKNNPNDKLCSGYEWGTVASKSCRSVLVELGKDSYGGLEAQILDETDMEG